MQGLLADKDYDGLEHILQTYSERFPENEIIRYSYNNAVNALLNYYAQIAKMFDIQLIWEIGLPKDLPVTDAALCSILGNILDNATAACESVAEERWIQLNVSVRTGNHLFIVATNPFSGSLRTNGKRYFSTHKHGEGIGLSSIHSIAERYHGRAHFFHEGQIFYSDVMIPLS